MYIQYPLNFDHQQNLYHDKQMEMDVLFDEYKILLLKNINHPVLIQEWEFFDAAAYETKFTPRNKATIKEEIK